MVVLSAAIVSSGKTLVARQFVEMTRLRVEGLLSAFQKLVDTGRDHTFIETESVRYVYQPMEALHLLLVTNKSSNILEDLETLRLLAKVVQDCCHIQVNEELVLKHALDIVFAFDEVVSFGHRESVTLSQIKSYTEMDSHEEKLQQMIEISKINEARETAKKKAKEMKQKQIEAAREGTTMPGFGSNSSPSPQSNDVGSGFGSSGFGSSGSNNAAGFQDTMSAGVRQESFNPVASMGADNEAQVFRPKKEPGKGMNLKPKRPGADLFAGLGVSEPATTAAAEAAQPETAAAPVVNPLLDPVRVDIEERIVAEMSEGALEGDVSCTGQFQVLVLDAQKADLVCFKLNPQSQEFKYKVHPNLNKASYANNLLELRDPSKKFSANVPAPLLKWQFKTSDEAFLPITLSCWPTAVADGTQMVLEFELQDDSAVLEDVHVRFPAPPSARPAIASFSPGEAVYDGNAQQVHWIIPVIDKSESSGTLEFTAAADAATLLPGEFEAVRRGATRCPMDVLECFHQETKAAISFACEKSTVYAMKITK